MRQAVSQRKLVEESAVRATPAGKIVMAHIGAGSTEDAVELARHAERCGRIRAAAKEMLGWRGAPCGDCRAPRANLTAEQKRVPRAKLDEMDLPRRR